jgi:hypothetical protein
LLSGIHYGVDVQGVVETLGLTAAGNVLGTWFVGGAAVKVSDFF